MLKRLQRYFGDNAPVNAALVAVQQEEEVSMTTEVTQSGGASADVVDVAALQSAVTSLTEQLAQKDAVIEELTAQVEAAAEFKAAQEKAAFEAKVAARTAKLVAVVGTEQAASLQAATASMDDAAFDAVVAAMDFKAKAESAAPAFKEVGVDGSADSAKLVADASGNRVMDYLKTLANENQA